MLETTSRSTFPRIRVGWFREAPPRAGWLGLAEFKQCTKTAPRLGYVRRPFSTLLVDLGQTPEQLMAGFKPRTRSFVRQAERLGAVAGVERDRAYFIRTYNAFARRRGLATLDAGHVLARPGPALVTRVAIDGRVLAMRGYLVDREIGRARNLVSCTAEHPPEDQETQRLIGLAHRYLVFADMLRLREEGIATYDFGGYALATSDPKLANINRFKDSFGGSIVSEPTYVSWPLHASLAARGWLARTLRGSTPGSLRHGLAP
ncbi:hypothetical protein [Marinimicrococcus flavescens]|uniref:Uncharacterized protein n=1 Tax=Marinimicrococcus flavescens TaxID=3031815 RepID=A0AAP3XPY6_9PROT|nr:hypothetical protein [Marinimicrococcus flavescens]